MEQESLQFSSSKKQGRPSVYKKEYDLLSYRVIKTGATMQDLAYILDISRDTLYLWIKNNKEFRETVEKAKKEVLELKDNRTNAYKFDSIDGEEKRKKLNKRNNDYQLKRRSEDINYKLRTNMAANLRARLKLKNITGGFKLLDYSVDDLKNRLESKFVDGMNWDNFGKWHIDHIKPASLFNYKTTNCYGFKECWSLENLQPLWALDNLKKSNKYDTKKV